MKHPTNETIEPALWWVPIRGRAAPLMRSSGPTNIHEYHSRALPMNARSDTPPSVTKSHETTTAQSRPTTSRKIDMEDRVMGQVLSGFRQLMLSGVSDNGGSFNHFLTVL